MSDKRRLAWKLAKWRWRSITRWEWYPERIRQRDFLGTFIADWVSLSKCLWCTATGRYSGSTEIERRAVVCARRRLVDQLHREDEANE